MNRYTYCANNPVRYVDPTGYSWADDYEDEGYYDDDDGNEAWQEWEKEYEEKLEKELEEIAEKRSGGGGGPLNDEELNIIGQWLLLGNNLNGFTINTEHELFTAEIGLRGAATIGAELGTGIVINPNNYWDSGIILKVGVGTGVEIGFDTPLSKITELIIEAIISTVDFSKDRPTSSKDIEGGELKATASFMGGISFDLENKEITGIETLSIGGGVYATYTTVVTVGEVTEAIVNIPFAPLILFGFMNPIDVDGQ